MDLIKLYDSELAVMEILWDRGNISAKEVSLIALEQIGWNKNTTYTILKKLVEKGAIKRIEPRFQCQVCLSKEQIQKEEAKQLVTKYFGGSIKKLFASFITDETLSKEELEALRDMIRENE